MGSSELSALYDALIPDPSRQGMGFSPDMDEAQHRLREAATASARVTIINDWLSKYQPCLFGKIAARSGRIAYCLLEEEDLSASDEAISEKIQRARLGWKRSAMRGEQSAFVVAAITPRLELAEPNQTMRDFSVRLANLYLARTDCTPDTVALESVQLQIPSTGDLHILRWQAGVNVFAACADRRWWQDHRIPGGLAFSVNSVGHMVKSTTVVKTIEELHRSLALESDVEDLKHVETLTEALVLAMRTISNASATASGKATRLLNDGEVAYDESAPACPFTTIEKKLEGKDCRTYRGHYHTDYTVPEAYFSPAIERPPATPAFDLDFTYLFFKHLKNPDHVTMGLGEQVAGDHINAPSTPSDWYDKSARAHGELVSPSELEELRNLL